jgi:hypothetical protein
MIDTAGLPAGDVIFDGVPFPEDGDVFGWVAGGTVAAVICCYTEPGPVISVMPLAGTPETSWPAFTGRTFGGWFWDAYRAGDIVHVYPAIAATTGSVYGLVAADGFVQIGVASEVAGDDWTLPRGVYAYHRVLRAGGALPLNDLLSNPAAVDLGSRFRDC